MISIQGGGNVNQHTSVHELFFELAKYAASGRLGRIERFFGEKPTTVLLVKLAVGAELHAGAAALSSRGDLIRDYVRSLDAPIGEADRPQAYQWPKPLHDAQAISWTILDGVYHLREISRDAALEALGGPDTAPDRLKYLVERIQVFQWRGAETRLTATLDPVVEHLAALHLLDTHGREDEDFWSNLGAKIVAATRCLIENREATSTEGFVATLSALAAEVGSDHPVLAPLASLQEPILQAA